MKIKQLTILFALALTLGMAHAQSKIGHINSNELLLAMPERDAAEKNLEEFAKQLESQLTNMSLEYEKKLTEYQTNLETMSDPVKDLKAEELGDLERRIREFQRKAQESIQLEESKLMEPLITKAQDAIKKVASNNKYDYVFDSSVGVLLHFPEGDDILPLVRQELGLPATQPASTGTE